MQIFLCPTDGPLPLDALALIPSLIPKDPTFALIRVGLTQPIERQGCVADADAMLAFYGISGSVGTKVR